MFQNEATVVYLSHIEVNGSVEDRSICTACHTNLVPFIVERPQEIFGM